MRPACLTAVYRFDADSATIETRSDGAVKATAVMRYTDFVRKRETKSFFLLYLLHRVRSARDVGMGNFVRKGSYIDPDYVYGVLSNRKIGKGRIL